MLSISLSRAVHGPLGKSDRSDLSPKKRESSVHFTFILNSNEKEDGKMRNVMMVFCVLVSLVIVSSANAAQIAAWDMFGQPGNQAFTASSSSDANVTGFNMVRGAGLGVNTGNNSMNSNGWGSTDADDYFEFGFNVASGFQVSLDSLIIGTRSSNTGPGTWGLYTSQDGFSSPVDTLMQSGSDFLNSTIDLSSLAPVTGDFFVRILEIGNTQADGSGTTSNSGTFRIVDFFDNGDFIDTQFTGTVSSVSAVVPVPAPLFMLVCAMGALAGLKKVRR